MTNHNLANRYFRDTKGNVLVNVVIIIQAKLIRIAIVMGCLSTDMSYFLSKSTLKIKISITPNKSGSVGKNIPIPPNSSASKFNDSGVVKTINHNSLSVATKAINSRTRANGMTANQYCSSAISALLIMMNKKLKINTQFDFNSSDILFFLVP